MSGQLTKCFLGSPLPIKISPNHFCHPNALSAQVRLRLRSFPVGPSLGSPGRFGFRDQAMGDVDPAQQASAVRIPQGQIVLFRSVGGVELGETASWSAREDHTDVYMFMSA